MTTAAIQEQVWGEGLTSAAPIRAVARTAREPTTRISPRMRSLARPLLQRAVYLGVTPTSAGAPGGVRQFDFSGTLSAQDDTSKYQQQGTRGTSPFISANGTSDGIVWMIDQGNPLQNGAGAAPTHAALIAFDAANYPAELYTSATNSGDAPGYGIKFSSPVVANGKVYISTGTDLTTVSNPKGEIDVYGLK